MTLSNITTDLWFKINDKLEEKLGSHKEIPLVGLMGYLLIAVSFMQIILVPVDYIMFGKITGVTLIMEAFISIMFIIPAAMIKYDNSKGK